jgi:hypothetical protein
MNSLLTDDDDDVEVTKAPETALLDVVENAVTAGIFVTIPASKETAVIVFNVSFMWIVGLVVY